MQEATDPSGDHKPSHVSCSQSIAVGTLRPKIAHSKMLLGQAEKEPPFIARHRMMPSKWRPVLASLEALITKVAALESLLEGTLLLLLQWLLLHALSLPSLLSYSCFLLVELLWQLLMMAIVPG